MAVLFITINVLIQKTVIAPVENLTETMGGIRDGDFGRQISGTSDDELGMMVSTFNAMSSEIAGTYARIEKQNTDLEEARSLLRSVINSMPSLLILIDDQGRIQDWNEAATAFSGRTSDAVGNRCLDEALPMLGVRMDAIGEAILERTAKRLGRLEVRQGPEPRFLDILVYPIQASGESRAVILMDDVTDAVRMEKMMIQTEKMMSVGGLAAGMAHEINNPLAGMIQNAQVVINRLWGDLPANREAARKLGLSMEILLAYMDERGIRDLLEAIRKSGARAAQIVGNMLSFSRQSADRFGRHSLARLMDETIELAGNDYDLKKKMDFRNIVIVREYSPDMPEVQCEDNRIQQVFLNILKNGAEAMTLNRRPGGGQGNPGEGRPDPACFVIRIRQREDWAWVEIQDNGPGMDEATRKRVFEPFFTTKGIGQGTGLGLSVSYFIITEIHGGDLEVVSRPGDGATFIIRLPLEGAGR
jgi:PAS domain S-box-containing protein